MLLATRSAGKLETIEAESGDNPGATIIILHGLGADGNDFVPIAQELDLAAVGPGALRLPARAGDAGDHQRRLPHARLVRHPRHRARCAARTRRACARSQAPVEALIAREKERGIPAERIVLAGFSQGCAMALLTGLRHAERLAGIVGLSGYLPLAATTAAERSEANRDMPIFLAHGTHDDGGAAGRAATPRAMRCRRWATRSSGTSTRWRTRCRRRRSPT